jgi:hypothetical protein
MPENSSFDDLMQRLRRGDEVAAAAVFHRLTDRLIYWLAVSSTPARADLGGTWYRLAQTLETLGRPEEAIDAYQHACTNNRPIVFDQQPTIVKHRIWLGERYGDIARLQRELGRSAEPAAACLQRKALWPGNLVHLYRVARELALCAAVVGKDKTTLSSEEQAERRRYAGEAQQALGEAARAAAKYMALNLIP